MHSAFQRMLGNKQERQEVLQSARRLGEIKKGLNELIHHDWDATGSGVSSLLERAWGRQDEPEHGAHHSALGRSDQQVHKERRVCGIEVSIS